MHKELGLAAIDLGAESGRVIYGHLKGQRLSIKEIHRFRNRSVFMGRYLYWDLLNLFGNIKQGLRKIASQNLQLDGVAVDTWGVDYGLLDSSGELLANPISYRDHRTDRIEKAVYSQVSEEELYGETGIQIMTINTSFQLAALKKENPAMLAGARDLLFMPGLFTYFLCGQKANDVTISSTSQLYDTVKGDWAWGLLKRLGLPSRLFGPVISPGTVLGGLTAPARVFPEAEVIAVGGHDTASAVAAVPTEQEEFVYISCGTWSLIGTELAQPLVSEKARKINFSNEVGVADRIRFLRNVMGLWLLQQCRAAWLKQGFSYDYSQLTDLGAQAKPWRTLVDPDDPAFLNPEDMLQAIASFARQTDQPVPESVGEYVRCIFESLALKYCWVIERLQDLSGVSYDRIHMVGGGTQNEFLTQLTADVTGREVLAGPVEATAIGNLLMQGNALGGVGDLGHLREVVRNSFALKSYRPQGLSKEGQKALQRFYAFHL